MNERTYNSGMDRLRSPQRVERLEIHRVVDLILAGNNIHSVLDIGTGSALFAEEFSNRKVKVCGIDINPEMIEASRKLLPETEFKLAPAEKIPYEDESFDAVFMGLVFHEVEDYSKALKEAYRTAVKNVEILEWNYAEEEFGPPIKDRLSPEIIKTMAEEAGFKNVEIVPLNSLSLYRLKK